jgi:signal peptidase I
MESHARMKRRKWWLAGLLSLIMPGLGQLYNGEARKAVLLFFVPMTFIVLACPPVLLVFSIPKFIALFVIAGVYQIAVAIDAARRARRLANSYVLQKCNRWYMYLLFYLCASIIISVAQEFVRTEVKSFKLPSGSMKPTLLVGDYFLVDMRSSARKAQRGDIIIFVYPQNPTLNYIKRVAAVAGDTVEIRQKTLLINDIPQQEPYVMHSDKTTLDQEESPRDNFGPVVVPADSYFVMGDNRDNSYDSRFWGTVAASAVLGKVIGLYWSWDRESMTVRWSRIGRRIDNERSLDSKPNNSPREQQPLAPNMVLRSVDAAMMSN